MSVNIETKIGRTKKFLFQIDLNDTGYVRGDISDVFFVIKKDKTVTDTAIILKNTSDGVFIEATVDDKLIDVTVTITKAEFATLDIDYKYISGLFARFTGDDAANEEIKQDMTFKVLQDILINN